MIKKPTNGIEESKVWTNWGSETDSLCLSISIAGEWIKKEVHTKTWVHFNY